MFKTRYCKSSLLYLIESTVLNRFAFTGIISSVPFSAILLLMEYPIMISIVSIDLEDIVRYLINVILETNDVVFNGKTLFSHASVRAWEFSCYIQHFLSYKKNPNT